MKLIILRINGAKAKLIYLDERDIVESIGKTIIFASIIATPIDTMAVSPQIDAALQPLINTIQDLAKPICYGSMLWGWSKVMLGQKSAGYKQLKEAIGGFIGVQFTPMIFNMISQMGR